MKKPRKKLVLVSVAGFFLVNAFMNCSGFEEFDINGSISPSATIQSKTEHQNYTIQSADQMIRSMASVTDVNYETTIVNEFDIRKALLSTDYSMGTVTAPMMISIANLGSQFCNELIKKETSLSATERVFFKNVDFNKPVLEIQADQFDQILNVLSNKFWGRKISQEEKIILNNYKVEFIESIPEASKSSVVQTKGLILSTCTAVLGSIDFITI